MKGEKAVAPADVGGNCFHGERLGSLTPACKGTALTPIRMFFSIDCSHSGELQGRRVGQGRRDFS